jgi:hypothetical protein
MGKSLTVSKLPMGILPVTPPVNRPLFPCKFSMRENQIKTIWRRFKLKQTATRKELGKDISKQTELRTTALQTTNSFTQ